MEDLKICQKSTKYGQFSFIRLLRLIWQIPRRHHSTTQYQAHTLSSLCYLKIYLKPSTYLHKEFHGEKEGPKASITSLNKTDTCDGYNFNIDLINNDEYSALQKELLMLFEAYCIFGFWEFFKKLFCILEVNKTMYGSNEDVPKINWTICIQNRTYVMSHLQLCGMSLRQMKIRVSINHQ